MCDSDNDDEKIHLNNRKDREVEKWLYSLPFRVIHKCSLIKEIVDGVNSYFGEECLDSRLAPKLSLLL
jgi:hypothetical protein